MTNNDGKLCDGDTYTDMFGDTHRAMTYEAFLQLRGSDQPRAVMHCPIEERELRRGYWSRIIREQRERDAQRSWELHQAAEDLRWHNAR